MLALVFPIFVSSFVLLWGQYFFHQLSPLFITFLLLVSIIVSILYLRHNKNQLATISLVKLIKNHWFPLLFIIVYTIVIGLVNSPLLIPQQEGGYSYRRFPGAIDYFKHSYSITAINQSGIPPIHPYFPYRLYSYYYGYYLVPAAITKVTNLPQNTILFFYVCLTDAISMAILYYLVCQITGKKILRLFSLPLLVFGTSLDVIPWLLHLSAPGMLHIENWFGNQATGLMVYNIYTSLIWAPQHLFPAVISVFLVYQLWQNKKFDYLIFTVSVAFICLSSVFVALTTFFWFLLLFIFKTNLRKFFIISAFFCLLLLIPFYPSLLSQGGLFSFYLIHPFPFMNDGAPLFLRSFVNFSLTALVEYGPVFFILLIFIKKHSLLKTFLAIYFPVLITWFIRSSGPNDFSMKSILPVLLLFNLILIKRINDSKHRYSILIVSVCILFGIAGSGWEYFHLWKKRLLIPLAENELFDKLNELPANYQIAVVDRNEWVFHIPIFTKKTVLSPSLYDAGVYSGRPIEKKYNYDYEDIGQKIFFRQSSSSTGGQSLVESKNFNLKELSEYLNKFPFNGLLLPKYQGVKQGLNFWYYLFSKDNIQQTYLTNSYSLFDYQSLKKHVDQTSIFFDFSKTLELTIKDQQLKLPSGFWLVYGCNQPGKPLIKLELEDYYTIFVDSQESANSCVGNVFYHQSRQSLVVSSSTTISSVYATPLTTFQN